MTLKIRITMGATTLYREVEIKTRWFGSAYVVVEGRKYEVVDGNTLTLEIPITFALMDKR